MSYFYSWGLLALLALTANVTGCQRSAPPPVPTKKVGPSSPVGGGSPDPGVGQTPPPPSSSQTGVPPGSQQTSGSQDGSGSGVGNTPGSSGTPGVGSGTPPGTGSGTPPGTGSGTPPGSGGNTPPGTGSGDDPLRFVRDWSGDKDQSKDGWVARHVKLAENSGGGTPGTGGQSGGSNAVSYEGQIRELLTISCMRCHSPDSGRRISPFFADYDSARSNGQAILASVTRAQDPMPQGGSLSDAQKGMIKAWVDAGFPKEAASGGSRGGSSDATGGQQQGGGQRGQGGEPTFAIPTTLVNGAWNSPDNPVVVKVGSRLTIKNETDKDYWIHTNGAPFPHPGQTIPAGGSATYVIRSAFQGALRQHDGTPNRFQFYIRATQ